MFYLQDNESLDKWFQRLNAPLKRLPTDERIKLHQEVRQHLEALAAANEELGSSPEEAWEHALVQFGDPSRFGRQMRREALTLPRDPNLWSKDPLKAATLYTFVGGTVSAAVEVLLSLLAVGALLLIAPGLPLGSPWNGIHASWLTAICVSGMVTAGYSTGLRMKQKAVLGTFYGLLPLCGFGAAVSICRHDLAVAIMIMMLMGLVEGCLASWGGVKLRQAWERKSARSVRRQVSPQGDDHVQPA